MNKAYVFSLFALVLVSVYTACTKEESNTSINDSNTTVLLSVNALSPETRTVFGDKTDSGYPITWSASGEAIELIELITPADANASASYKDYSSSSYSLSDGNSKAMFSAEIDAMTTEGTYDYHALYPQSAYKSTNIKYKDLYAIIPDTQTPSNSASPDPSATLLYAGSIGHNTQASTSLDMGFSHITAYGRMTIKNASNAFGASTETISSVTISVPSGGVYYYWETGEISPVSSTAKATVTIKTDNINTAGDFDVWFACAPYSLSIDDELTVSVSTNANTYTRIIKMTKDMSFESGNVSKFTVNMASAGAADDLSGNYLIASTDGTNPWYLMTYEVSNNVYLGAATNVSASTTLNANVLSDFCSNIYVWTLEKVSGGYTLKNAYSGKYAAVNSDNNYGHASTSPVTLTVSDNGEGVFTVTAQNFPSRSLQFNYNSGNTRFAFYGSSQKALHFIPVTSYKTALDKPTVSASASGSTISVSWNAIDNATSYTVTCGEAQKSISGTSTEFTNLSDGQYTVTVTAIGSGTYANSLTASTNVVVSSVGGTTVEFEVADFSGQGTSSSGSSISATKSGITFSCNKGYGTTQIRCYSGGEITISSTVGNISQVDFTFSGTYTGGLDSSYLYTGQNTTVSYSLVSQARLTKITVKYTN